MLFHNSWILILLLASCRLTFGQELAAGSESSSDAAASSPHRLACEHLPNAIQLHPKVISGGLPEGDEAFRELSQLGVKTIISVDGSKPDVQRANQFGIRYVHLPHGYDGVSDARRKELAKAVRDLPGPVYVHCHHGKHRSPAAAAVACIGAGLLPFEQGVSILELAGTNPNYRGLYESAREARALAAEELDSLQVQFPPSVAVPPMAEAMVAIGHTHDHLKLIAQSNYRAPTHHPDLDPAHEALLLREHFTELLRTPEVAAEPERFQRLMREAQEHASSLESTLLQRKASVNQTSLIQAASTQLKTIERNCKACHESYRDPPLSEK